MGDGQCLPSFTRCIQGIESDFRLDSQQVP